MRAFLRIIIMRYAQILKRNMFYASLAILVSAHFSGPEMDELYFSPPNPCSVDKLHKITKFYFTSESMRLHPCWLHSNSTHSNNLAKNLNRHAHSYKNWQYSKIQKSNNRKIDLHFFISVLPPNDT